MKTSDIQEITNGNEAAAAFVGAFVRFCHVLDDVQDGAKPADTVLVRASLELMEAIGVNPWGKDNFALLWPLIVSASSAWLDANQWQHSGQKNLRTAADVLKGMYHEVVWFTAYLCGGWEHQRKIVTKYREYDFEEEE